MFPHRQGNKQTSLNEIWKNFRFLPISKMAILGWSRRQKNDIFFSQKKQLLFFSMKVYFMRNLLYYSRIVFIKKNNNFFLRKKMSFFCLPDHFFLPIFEIGKNRKFCHISFILVCLLPRPCGDLLYFVGACFEKKILF